MFTIQLLKTYLYDQQICHIRIKQLKQEKPTNLNADTSNTFCGTSVLDSLNFTLFFPVYRTSWL